MESIPNQLPAGRDASCSPNSKQDPQSYTGPTLKPNQVSETSLYGIPIVSLVIDGQERLCLAQISNTLLKNYSYNEIHNRRVALGITCVQCTPVQLEILRRAGAMPISSRRCGMITKREAERLCKSFLGAHSPPKLPENFAFDVSHECAWGSRGNFIPTRYNSSRAKCIKCSFCNMYFSPNKFIFHSHRMPDSKYTQPDAANFNSWRRHLKLSDKNSPEDLAHAWEDVKAMFNGGSRKRTLPVGRSDGSSPLRTQGPGGQPQGEPSEVPHKTLRCEDDRGAVTMPSSIRSYPVIPVPSKSFGMLQKIPPPLFPHPYGFPAFGLCQKKDDGVVIGEPNKTNLSGVFWPSAKDSAYPSFPMFWPTTGSLAMPTYHHAQPKPPSDVLCATHSDLDLSEQSDRSTSTPKDSLLENERCSSTQSARNEEDKSGDESRSAEGMPATPRKISYISAFRPVVKDVESIAKLYGNRGPYSGPRSGYLSPDFLSESSSYRSVSPDVDSVDDPDVDVESHKVHEDDECLQLSVDDRRSPPGSTVAQSEGVKVQEQENSQIITMSDLHSVNSSEKRQSDLESHGKSFESNKHTTRFEVYSRERDQHMHQMSTSYFGSTTTYQRDSMEPNVKDVHEEEPSSTVEEMEPKIHQDQANVPEERLKESNDDEETIRKPAGSRKSLIDKDIKNMAKEELQKQLVEQVELRKKLEREFQNLKDSFQDQMKRELSYREEMVQQLQIVRAFVLNDPSTFFPEAHDALHHFSCKMLTPRHCTGTCTFKPPLLPP
ncbi:SKI family transcriptional corepressor 1 homolog-B isoform X1 [Myxocyprinus asiaticus]|uniref:SKI family transcriptional corepressor 1 homolog-B isoform X1 n=1 Tax=Myxocyprinus asiaticus TaxID=70543 RepID=UPI002223B079|nr:SKI family transcriptional corepressor 1 homolog-B isoform X1 [Myxocyprinus asiaticus]XP_051513048.1 SKI family transcriptional corepressor 1 homolog-B isoform X1 [Myxocyprinus asiaticus]